LDIVFGVARFGFRVACFLIKAKILNPKLVTRNPQLKVHFAYRLESML
jgi:hypothetical protein